MVEANGKPAWVNALAELEAYWGPGWTELGHAGMIRELIRSHSTMAKAIREADEWIGWDVTYCYWCKSTIDQGHEPDCVYLDVVTGRGGDKIKTEG